MGDVKDGEASEAAERYAQAAFELARDENALPALDADFAKLSAAFAESEELRKVAASPLIDPEEKARAIVAIAEKLGLSTLGKNLAGVVTKNRRAGELPQIAAAFRKRYARHRQTERADIYSAAKLSDAEIQSIADAIGKAMNTKVEAQAFVDESLLGGFVVRIGSRQFDASLKSKLAGLRLALKQSA